MHAESEKPFELSDAELETVVGGKDVISTTGRGNWGRSVWSSLDFGSRGFGRVSTTALSRIRART